MTNLGIDFDTYVLYNFYKNKFRQNYILFVKILPNNRLIKSYTYSIQEGVFIMTDNELELLNLIRTNDNPEEAIIKATEIILSYLTQSE